MNPLRIIEGDLRVGDLRIALVASRFNAPVVERLVAGAVEALAAQGADPASLELVRVPGAFDLPLVVRRLAESRRCDAIVALGAVIRGETYHFEIVANESARGVAEVQLEFGIPVGNGILTTNTDEQALMRCEKKGFEAAQAALELANLLEAIDAD